MESAAVRGAVLSLVALAALGAMGRSSVAWPGNDAAEVGSALGAPSGRYGPGERVSVPAALVVATSRGELVVPVAGERGHPAFAVGLLAKVLPVASQVDGDWAEVTFGGQPFRFLLDAPWLIHSGRVVPLAGGAYRARDTLFVPLQWLADYVPRIFKEGYRYDPLAARFEEAGLAPVVRTTSPPASRGAAVARRPSPIPGGPLRYAHKVVIDPGHGGEDGGNPGLFFPKGVQEKDVVLAIALKLRDELVRRGIDVELTRTTDRRVNLVERARRCSGDCDVFVSIHVNSLRPRPGYQEVSGFETYFLGAEVTAEARRVADMENEALRYETSIDPSQDDAFAFILKDLQTNEYLRESAALAEAVQRNAARIHPGGGRRIFQADRLAVLRAARRPAILIETGYATNRTDARFLASPEGQRRLAVSIADGIVEYLMQYERKIAAGESW
ncbi:N-acetylmuramoyl-L-alanine amidase AmiA [bacterium HR33]|nr:N-acetylmuramoyl-L-alanine amidase AmiA [bacterium HR33]